MNKLTGILGTLCLVILFAFLIVLGCLFFWPTRTMELHRVPLPIDTPVVRAGTDLIYVVDYCRYDIDGAQVYRTLYGANGISIPTPEVNTVTLPGCHIAHIHFTIPSETPPGTYYLDILTVIQVNPLRVVQMHTTTVTFTVN